jgi:hypothetical protein
MSNGTGMQYDPTLLLGGGSPQGVGLQNKGQIPTSSIGVGMQPRPNMFDSARVDVAPTVNIDNTVSDRRNAIGQGVANAGLMLAQEAPISGMLSDSANEYAQQRGAQEEFQVGAAKDKYYGAPTQVGEYSFLTDDLYQTVDKGDFQLDNAPGKRESASTVLSTAGQGASAGATMGAAFSPVGSAIGAAVGLVGGLVAGGVRSRRNKDEAKHRQNRMNQLYINKLEEQRQKREVASRELNKKNQEKRSEKLALEQQNRQANIASTIGAQRSNVMGMAGDAVRQAGLMDVNQPTQYQLG